MDIIYYRHYTIFPIIQPMSHLDIINLKQLIKNKFWRYCEKENAITLSRRKLYKSSSILKEFMYIVDWLNANNYYLCGKLYYRTINTIHLIIIENNNNIVNYYRIHDEMDIKINKNEYTSCYIDYIITDAEFKIDLCLKKTNLLDRLTSKITKKNIFVFLSGSLVTLFTLSAIKTFKIC